MNTVTLYHGNFQFEHTETEKNISPDYVQAQLAKEYEKQQEAGILDEMEIWYGILIVNGVKTEWVLDYDNCQLIEVPQDGSEIQIR